MLLNSKGFFSALSLFISIHSAGAGILDSECTIEKGENAANFKEDAARIFINKCFKNSKGDYDKTKNSNCYNAFVKKRCTDLGNKICVELFKTADLPRYNLEKPEADKREAAEKAAKEAAAKEVAEKAAAAKAKTAAEVEAAKKREKENHAALMNSKGHSNAQDTVSPPD